MNGVSDSSGNKLGRRMGHGCAEEGSGTLHLKSPVSATTMVPAALRASMEVILDIKKVGNWRSMAWLPGEEGQFSREVSTGNTGEHAGHGVSVTKKKCTRCATRRPEKTESVSMGGRQRGGGPREEANGLQPVARGPSRKRGCYADIISRAAPYSHR